MKDNKLKQGEGELKGKWEVGRDNILDDFLNIKDDWGVELRRLGMKGVRSKRKKGVHEISDWEHLKSPMR